MKHYLIDTDTASDDAVALIMALRHPEVRVEAITVVAGNVPLDLAVQNALYTTELCEADVPVYAGLGAPLVQPLVTAQQVHGQDGMGDIGLELSGRVPHPGHAVDQLIRRIRDRPGEITLVTLGPLSNVAVALLVAPDIAGLVDGCVIMGGTGKGPGNVTPLAEFNIFVDPEAAHIVFRSGIPITLVGWDISTSSATFDPAAAAELRAIGSARAEFAIDIQGVVDKYARTSSKLEGFDLPDPIAMAVALDPTIATTVEKHVAVVTGDGPARGQTVIDWLDATGEVPNAAVVTKVPQGSFRAALRAALT